jgi:hypothetical protein
LVLFWRESTKYSLLTLREFFGYALPRRRLRQQLAHLIQQSACLSNVIRYAAHHRAHDSFWGRVFVLVLSVVHCYIIDKLPSHRQSSGMATTIVLDTHKVITRLKDRGFTEEQATGITEVVQEIDLSELATKSDLQELKVDMMKWNATVMAIGVAILL